MTQLLQIQALLVSPVRQVRNALIALALGAFACATAMAGPTTTTLTATPNPAYVSQSVTLTATVTGTSPTGTVTFKDGTTTLGTATLSSGIATLSKTFTTTGSHSLTAAYGGNTGNSASTSAAVALTVNPKVNTSTSLTSTPNPAFVSQSVTLTATVSGSNPTGTITFKNGTTTLGTATLSGGVATRTQTFTTAGAQSLTAVYGGDTANNTSTSATVTETINAKASPSVSLAASPNPAYANQSVTLTATISSPTATGTVTFKDGTTTLGTASASSGVATLAKTFTTTGAHSLTAAYAGDAANNAATSPATSLTVNAQATTTTSLGSSNDSPAIGQVFNLVATVAGSSPTGTVTFKDGTTAIGTVNLSGGQAVLATSFGTAGTRTLKATYNGDAANKSSTSTAISQTVNTVATQVALSSASSVGTVGVPLTLTATVTGYNPTGTVTFQDQSAILGTASLASGVATLNVAFTVTGSRQVQAYYSGDGANSSNWSSFLTINVNPGTPSIAASANPRSVISGNSTTLSATITGGLPTGRVLFYEGSTLLGETTIVAGQTSASVSGMLSPAGLHYLHAVYEGDANNLGATSDKFVVSVGSGATVSPPGNMTWLYGYNAEGSLTTIVDPNGNQSNLAYDNVQQRVAAAQPQPSLATPQPLTTYSYNAQGRLVGVQDPRGLSTNSTLDGLGNLKSYSSPDTGLANATYDVMGNLLTRTDARGKTTTYTYDALNRLTSATYPTGSPTLFEYDGGATPAPNSIGRLTKITDESGSTTYTYDALGRVLSKTQLVGSGGGAKTFAVLYAWGNSGQATGKLTSITYPSGTRVNYGYDTAGRLNSISISPVNANGSGTSGSTVPVLSGVAYNGSNNVLGWTWAGGASYARTFDSFDRLSTYPLGNPAGTGNASGLVRTLSYDNAGRIVGYTHSNALGAQTAFDQTFIYDGVDRLTVNSQTPTNYGYGYDATGNRTSLTVGATTYQNVVEPTSNRLSSVQRSGSSGVVTDSYQYDAAGNLTSDGSSTYAYSDRGRMSSATTAAGTIQYKYNGLEQRVSKVGTPVATGAAYYAYDEAGRLLGEYDANKAPIHEMVYLADDPVSVLKQSGSAANGTLAVNVSFVYPDHLATPRLVARSSDHAIQWRWDTAEAFGAAPPNGDPGGLGTFTLNQRFPGQVFDAETSNFQNWNRDYGAAIGRYVQSDPVGLDGGINTYSYVGGNPLSYTDPMGLAPDIRVCVNGVCSPPPPPVWNPDDPRPAPPALPDLTKPSPWLPTWNWDGITWPSWMESRRSDKERATDVPSWSKQYPRKPEENCAKYAERILNEHYGCDDPRAKDRGPGSEYSKIKKHCERGSK